MSDHHQTNEIDLMVIGTGGAGMGAAIKGAELGYRVCVVEAGTIGGTCVNIGCVPSKTLIRAADAMGAALDSILALCRREQDFRTRQYRPAALRGPYPPRHGSP